MEKFNEDDGVWRTIRGRRVFIREGESVESAMSRSGKFSRVERNKDKYDKIDAFKKRKATNKLDEEPTPKKKIRLVKDKDNRYIVSRGDDDEAIRNYKRNYGDEKEREQEEKDEQDAKRRQRLIDYTQNNREQIKKWADEYDEETNKQAFEKAKRGEGLSAKEYFGMLGSQERPGDIITDVTADGEDVIVAKDGKWVRKSRIKAYNDNPSANKDAIVDIEEEERKIERQEAIENFKRRKK